MNEFQKDMLRALKDGNPMHFSTMWTSTRECDGTGTGSTDALVKLKLITRITEGQYPAANIYKITFAGLWYLFLIEKKLAW
jgi:hypothetical protein